MKQFMKCVLAMLIIATLLSLYTLAISEESDISANVIDESIATENMSDYLELSPDMSIDIPIEAQYENGSSDSIILYLQQQLYSLGFLKDEPTGIMDNATQSALSEYRATLSLEATTTYIGNRKTKKFHLSDCKSVSEMNESNKVAISSRDEAIELGYAPCKRCNP